MKRLAALLVGLMGLIIALPATARDKTYFEAGEPIAIDIGKAYFTFREIVSPAKYRVSLILVRLLDDSDYAAAAATRRKDGSFVAPSNVVVSLGDAIYATDAGQNLFVFSAPPGRYILAGLAYVNKNGGPLFTCLCMGTVAFTAEAGKVTNMGTLLAALDSQPSTIPELVGLVRGYDLGIRPFDYVAGLRLPAQSLALPAAMASLPVVAADYRAFDKFPNSLGASVERLAAIDGVLGYEGDRVIDVKAKAKNR